MGGDPLLCRCDAGQRGAVGLDERRAGVVAEQHGVAVVGAQQVAAQELGVGVQERGERQRRAVHGEAPDDPGPGHGHGLVVLALVSVRLGEGADAARAGDRSRHSVAAGVRERHADVVAVRERVERLCLEAGEELGVAEGVVGWHGSPFGK